MRHESSEASARGATFLVVLLVVVSAAATPVLSAGTVKPSRYVVLVDNSGSMQGKCQVSCMPCATPTDCTRGSPGGGWECNSGRCAVAPGSPVPCKDIWSDVRALVSQQLLTGDMMPDGGFFALYSFSDNGGSVRRRLAGVVDSNFRRKATEWLGKTPEDGGFASSANCTYLHDIMIDLLDTLRRDAQEYSGTVLTVLTDGFDEGSKRSESELCGMVDSLRSQGFSVSFWRVSSFSYLPNCLCPPGKSYCQCHTDTDGIPDERDNCPQTDNPDQSDADGDTPGHGCFEQLACKGGGTACGGDACDTDNDNDGDPNNTDCRPLDPNCHHGATEVCDGLDNNCDGQIDEGFGRTADATDPCQYCPSGDCDGDNVPNESDNCWRVRNPDQKDMDKDCGGVARPFGTDPQCGDACDLDLDGDGIPENLGERGATRGTNPCVAGARAGCDDNCPFAANGGQEDTDRDGFGDECDCSYKGVLTFQPPAASFSVCRNSVGHDIQVQWRRQGPAERCFSTPPVLQLWSTDGEAVRLGQRMLLSADDELASLEWRLTQVPRTRPETIVGSLMVSYTAGRDPVGIEIRSGASPEPLATGLLFSGVPPLAASTSYTTESTVVQLTPQKNASCRGNGHCQSLVATADEDSTQVLRCAFAYLADEAGSLALSSGLDPAAITPAVIAEFGSGDGVDQESLRESRFEVPLGWKYVGSGLSSDLGWDSSVSIDDPGQWLEFQGSPFPVRVIQVEVAEEGGSFWWILLLLALVVVGALVAWRVTSYPVLRGLFVSIRMHDEDSDSPLFRRVQNRFKPPTETKDLNEIAPPLKGTLTMTMDKTGRILMTVQGVEKPVADRLVARVSRSGELHQAYPCEIATEVTVTVGQRGSRGSGRKESRRS